MRERHIESLENRLPSSSSLVAPLAAPPVFDDDDTPKKPSQDEWRLAQPKTQTSVEKIEPAVIAIANDLNVTDSVATQIVSSCRRAAPDATAEEILAVAKAEAVRIAERTAHGLRVVNSIGLLITSVPQRFQGDGLSRLRATRAARDPQRERREEQERRRKQQELEEARAILDNPNAHEIHREYAALVIRLAAGKVA